MKKLLLGILAFQLFAFAANAQIEKGSVLLGGKINYTKSNSDQASVVGSQNTSRSTKSNGFSFDPQIGYTLANNWVVGSILSFRTSKTVVDDEYINSTTSNSGNITTKANAFGAALFARKYLPFGDKFSAFAEISSGALWNNSTSTYVNSTDTSNENKTKYNEYQTSLLTGLAYFPKNWMAIELSTTLMSFIHYDHDYDNSNSNQSSNTFDFGLNASAINLGVSFFLNNK